MPTASSTPSPEPSPTAIPSATPEPVTFQAWNPDVVNVLSDLCGRCHNSVTLKGDLDLTSYEAALAGGGSGPAIVPGNPDASELVRVQKGGGHSEMLSGAQLAAIIEWIRAGAPQE